MFLCTLSLVYAIMSWCKLGIDWQGYTRGGWQGYTRARPHTGVS